MPFNELILGDTIERRKFEKEILNSLVYLPTFNQKTLKAMIKKASSFKKISTSKFLEF